MIRGSCSSPPPPPPPPPPPDPQLDGVEKRSRSVRVRTDAGGTRTQCRRGARPDGPAPCRTKRCRRAHRRSHHSLLRVQARAGRCFRAAGSNRIVFDAPALPAPAPRHPWRARRIAQLARPGRDSHHETSSAEPRRDGGDAGRRAHQRAHGVGGCRRGRRLQSRVNVAGPGGVRRGIGAHRGHAQRLGHDPGRCHPVATPQQAMVLRSSLLDLTVWPDGW